jgi:cell division protein FtsL
LFLIVGCVGTRHRHPCTRAHQHRLLFDGLSRRSACATNSTWSAVGRLQLEQSATVATSTRIVVRHRRIRLGMMSPEAADVIVSAAMKGRDH